MSNKCHVKKIDARSGFPLVDSLVSSIQAEEAIIQRILASLTANKPSAVMKAARDLAALRETPLAENCAD